MKERITVSIEKKLMKWIDEQVEKKVYANRSHGFEFLIFKDLKQGKR